MTRDVGIGRWTHAPVSRRAALQAGSIGLLGLGMNHVAGLRALGDQSEPQKSQRHRAVIYIFLSGGLAQHESFDPKPEAPDTIRGEFTPIATRTPGIQICEHLPLLAAQSDKWALVRSLTHPHNDHSTGHHVMLTGRSERPVGFDGNRPTPHDFPALPSVVTGVVPPRNNLPPAAVLPEKLVHVTGRTIPGQFAGMMGWKNDPWFIDASRFRDTTYIHGAFPEYGFHRWEGPVTPPGYLFEAPRFQLPESVLHDRFSGRLELVRTIDRQRRQLDQLAGVREFDRLQQSAISLLAEGALTAPSTCMPPPTPFKTATGEIRSVGRCSWHRNWLKLESAWSRSIWGTTNPGIRTKRRLAT